MDSQFLLITMLESEQETKSQSNNNWLEETVSAIALGVLVGVFGVFTLGNAFGLGKTSPFISQGIITAGIIIIVNGLLRPVSQVFIKVINKAISKFIK